MSQEPSKEIVMHEDPAPRRKPDPNRVHLALAITFAAAVIAAGVAVGHRPAEAQTGAALDRAAAATPTPAADGAGDPSVPAATGALQAAPHDPAEPTATF
jgi:hypothetical protein